MTIQGAKEHAEIDFYEQCMTFKPLHYNIQERMYYNVEIKGMTEDQALRELPPFAQEDAKRIYRRY